MKEQIKISEIAQVLTNMIKQREEIHELIRSELPDDRNLTQRRRRNFINTELGHVLTSLNKAIERLQMFLSSNPDLQ